LHFIVQCEGAEVVVRENSEFDVVLFEDFCEAITSHPLNLFSLVGVWFRPDVNVSGCCFWDLRQNLVEFHSAVHARGRYILQIERGFARSSGAGSKFDCCGSCNHSAAKITSSNLAM